MRALLESQHAKLEQIVIHDIKDSTFSSRSSSYVRTVKYRRSTRAPSDGIALALRMQAPIFVTDKIALEESVPDKKAEVQDTQKFKKFIDELKPSDFVE